MEPVLRSVELATNMSNNTDLNALLALAPGWRSPAAA